MKREIPLHDAETAALIATVLPVLGKCGIQVVHFLLYSYSYPKLGLSILKSHVSTLVVSGGKGWLGNAWSGDGDARSRRRNACSIG